MPKITDGTTVTTDIKTLVMLASMALALGGILYQNNELRKDVAALETKVTTMNDAIVGVVQTLRNNGTIR